MEKLIQTDRLFNKKIFELTDTGLRGQQKKLFSSVEYFVDYEDIGVRILKNKTGRNGLLVASIIGFMLTAVVFISKLAGKDVEPGAELLYLTTAIVCGTMYWLTYSRTFYLVQQGNKNAIEFICDNPTKESLDQFINTLKEKRRVILDDKYGQINVHLPYEQNHQNILWLFNNDVIDKVEFDNRVNELNSKFNRPTEKRIGFSFREN